MCNVSDKIKLCSCKTTSVEKLKHYWIFYRYNSEKNNIVIGDCILPYSVNEEMLIKNKAILLIRLNEEDAFDVDIFPKNKDKLQLTFTCSAMNNQKIAYGYSYKNGKWIEKDFDPFEWQWHHDEGKLGTIKPALVKTIVR